MGKRRKIGASKLPAPASPAPRTRRGNLVVCCLLLIASLLVFGQTINHGFINFDDKEYIYENPQVSRGLSLEGLAWAFTHVYADNWHPLTWISHMLDCQFYDLRPGGHHLTSVLLHALAAMLLFLAILRASGDFWPSAIAAAIFCIHPLRVESVAWAAERKDVLSGVFFMLTLNAYVRYAKAPFSAAKWTWVALWFVCGLMSKPMLVTLPGVLLLLDYWPLGRFDRLVAGHGSDIGTPLSRRLVVEKIPWMALAAASCAVTLLAQRGGIAPIAAIPLWTRIANAVASYGDYLVQFIFPVNLAVLYPHPGSNLPLWKFAAAAVVLTGVTAAAVRWRRQCPYFLVGWLWYLGMLVPVIGLVQVGDQAMADRYTYLPQIGLVLAVTWGCRDLTRSWPGRELVCGLAVAAALCLLGMCAWRQTSHWRDSETFWTHVLACIGDNARAHNNLGVVLGKQGRNDEAAEHFQQALKVDPRYLEACCNLANVLAAEGKSAAAVAVYEQALKINPQLAEVHANLANQQLRKGQIDAAIAHYRAALKINPLLTNIHHALALALLQQGRQAEAEAEWRELARIDPANAKSREGLGVALLQEGKVADALNAWRECLRLQPNNVPVLNATAWVLATAPSVVIRNGQEAFELADRAGRLTGGREPAILDTVAASLAETGRFDEAAAIAQRSLELAVRQQKTSLANDLRQRIRLYRAGSPYHQTGPTVTIPSK